MVEEVEFMVKELMELKTEVVEGAKEVVWWWWK